MGSVFDTVLRPAIVAASRSERIKDASQRWPVTERVVRRFVPGESLDAAMTAVGAELDDDRPGRGVHLGAGRLVLTVASGHPPSIGWAP